APRRRSTGSASSPTWIRTRSCGSSTGCTRISGRVDRFDLGQPPPMIQDTSNFADYLQSSPEKRQKPPFTPAEPTLSQQDADMERHRIPHHARRDVAPKDALLVARLLLGERLIGHAARGADAAQDARARLEDDSPAGPAKPERHINVLEIASE